MSSRVPKLAGLLAIGAVMGAVTAFVLRKRRQQQWEEYDPAEALAPEAERAEQPGETAGPPSEEQPSQAESQV